MKNRKKIEELTRQIEDLKSRAYIDQLKGRDGWYLMHGNKEIPIYRDPEYARIHLGER